MKTFMRSFLFIGLTSLAWSCSNDDDTGSEEAFTITSISAEAATVGTQITITGTGFPADPAAIGISFGGVAASVSAASSTQIVTEVPTGAVNGEVSVTIEGLSRSATATFTVLTALESATYANLDAPQTGGQGEPEGGPFIKFSFATGEVTDSETDWDIAFRGTTIAVNGGVATGANEEPARNGEAGAAIQSGTFGEITTADGLSFSQDAEGAYAVPTGSDNGWYNYNPATFTIAPIPGRILVFRTHDGRFAKVEILSYYRDAPAEPDPFTDESRVYTFKYVYNPNNGETTLAE